MLQWSTRHSLVLCGLVSLGLLGGIACSDDISDGANAWDLADQTPVIDVADELIFTSVASNERAEKELAVSNRGNFPLVIDDVVAPSPFEAPSLLAEEATPVVVEPGESKDVAIALEAPEAGTPKGTLQIYSNDPSTPVETVELRAHIAASCLEIMPGTKHDFGGVHVDESAETTFELRNCSEVRPTRVSVESVVGDPGFAADLDGASSSGEYVIESGGVVELQAVFSPQEAGVFEAEVLIETNADDSPRVIALGGEGGAFGCPVPRIEAVASGGQMASSGADAVLNVSDDEEVGLRGDESADFDGGTIAEYRWSLVERPEESQASLGGSEDAVENFLELDVAGSYLVELDVKNDSGDWSCEPAQIVVYRVAERDIELQLVWDSADESTPREELDIDMDLHFLHPEGEWDEKPYDCHWKNPNPAWSSIDDGSGDPMLEEDITAGGGPENIVFENPAEGRTYGVGVRYFGGGDSDQQGIATVRVFIRGELIKEVESVPLFRRNFWEALEISWPSEEIEVIDEVRSEGGEWPDFDGELR